MAADELALFLTYLFFDCDGHRAASGIQNAKAYAMTAPRGFRQYFIFVCFWTGELRIVLRHARKHIDAFSWKLLTTHISAMKRIMNSLSMWNTHS